MSLKLTVSVRVQGKAEASFAAVCTWHLMKHATVTCKVHGLAVKKTETGHVKFLNIMHFEGRVSEA